MNIGKGILRAAAPLTALLFIAAGARLLPSVFGKDDAVDEGKALSVSAAHKPPLSSGKGKPKTPPTPPKAVDARTQATLQKVVSSQLSAIAKDDFALALRYSAPAFRMSNSPDTFRQMVRTGYAGLLKYKALRFAGAKRSTDIAMMPVFVKSESGNEVGYLYILRRDTSKSALKPKNGEKPTRQSPKSSADMSTWYIEGVSPLGGGGYPGAGRPESGRITDVREI